MFPAFCLLKILLPHKRNFFFLLEVPILFLLTYCCPLRCCCFWLPQLPYSVLLLRKSGSAWINFTSYQCVFHQLSLYKAIVLLRYYILKTAVSILLLHFKYYYLCLLCTRDGLYKTGCWRSYTRKELCNILYETFRLSYNILHKNNLIKIWIVKIWLFFLKQTGIALYS